MLAYLVERLFPAGWRRDGEIHWRLGEAIAVGNAAIDESLCRG